MGGRATETADVVVIGCGVAGAWTALFLARIGVQRIIVLERAHPGAGASTKGTGLLRVHYSNIAEMRLALEGQRHYLRWSDEVGIGSAGVRPTGLLWLVGPEDVDRLRLNVADQVALGGRASALLRDEIARMQPHLDLEGVGGAVYEPDSGTAIGRLAIEGLVSRLLVDGVDVRTHMPVRRIVREGERVVGVETADGTIATECVVLAAGAWSAALAKTAEVNLPLTPKRATVGTAYYPPSIEPAIALFDNMLDFAFAPKAGGHWAMVPVRDAAFLTEADPDCLEEPGWAAVEAGLALITRRIPAMRDARPAERWVAADGCTPDRKPIIGEHPELRGLFVHAGGNFKGFKVAPSASRVLADEIARGRTTDSLIAEFSPGRMMQPAVSIPDHRQYVGARWT
jgi:glycine/D-amino acid oxidase-like deaminating enzyme